jgi:hypothetical protein
MAIALASLSLAGGAAVWQAPAAEALSAQGAAPSSSSASSPPSEVSRPAADAFPAPLAPAYPDASDPAALGRWFAQTTHLPAKSILAITENAIFAAFPQRTSGVFWTVDVRLESITPQSTAKLGGRSIRLRLNVRCDNNTVRLAFLDAYPGADLTGAPSHRAPQNDWALPKPNSYVADAVRLACDKTFKPPFAAIAAGAAPLRLEPKTAPPSEPATVETEPGPTLRPRQPLSGGYAVQIGAYSTPAVAQGAWRALQTAMPEKTSGLSNATRRIEVGGRIFYRALIEGFPSRAAAAAFCQTLRASGRPCLIVGR